MSEQLKRTPLYDLHLELGAKMVPFAGYEMPVQYPMGVRREHLHTREQAGLFDVSHMGQVQISGERAAISFESLVPVDICDLPVGKQRYAVFTNDQGGIEDDLMVSHFGDHLYVVVNAACKQTDIAMMQQKLDVEVTELADRALVALQGPAAAKVFERFCPESADMVFMDSRRLMVDGVDCIVSRSGYTGEDGFEISIPADQAESLCRQILAQPEVEMIGLGARDSLRLESGLCLYGHDLDPTTTPVEASLLWAISKARRADGDRAYGFPGAEIIYQQIAEKSYSRKRVGLVGLGKAPVREGALLLNSAGEQIGKVTSGSFGPSVEKPIIMAYIDPAYAAVDTEVFAEVRGKQLPLQVCKMPFVEQRYYRG